MHTKLSLGFRLMASLATAILVLTAGCGGGGSGGPTRSTNLIEVTGGANGLVIGHTNPVRLAVQVKTRSGSPVAVAPVTFLAPGSGASVTFTGGEPAAPYVYHTVTDATGEASAFITRNAQDGVFLVDAMVDDTEIATTFAITNTSVIAPNLAADKARQAVKQQFMGSRPEDETMRLHGPAFVPSGTIITADGPNTSDFPVVPYTVTRESWVFWLDEDPMAAFTHETRFIVLDANDYSPGFGTRARVSKEGWWPRIKLPGGAANGTALVPAYMRGDTTTRSAASPSQYRVGRAPDDACAIFVYGPNTGKAGKKDIDAFRDFLISSGKVKASNCIPPPGHSAGDKPTTPEQLDDWIKNAKNAGCGKLYFVSVSHGYLGGFCLATDKSNEPNYADVSYKDLADKLKGNWELDMYVWACQAGTAQPYFSGPGFNGHLVTSAQKGKSAFFYGDYEFTFFGEAFLECWKDSNENGPNKGNAGLDEAFKWTVAHAGEGKQPADWYKTKTLIGGPDSVAIGSHYTPQPDMLRLPAYSSGAVQLVKSGSILSQATTVTIAAHRPEITVQPTAVFPPQVNVMPIQVVVGGEPDTFTIDVVDSTNSLSTKFFVHVYQLVTLAKTLTAPDGTTFAAGTVISTDRMTNYHFAKPDTGCDKYHLHALSAAGITLDGHGPIIDPQPTSCGYGMVIQPPAGK